MTNIQNEIDILQYDLNKRKNIIKLLLSYRVINPICLYTESKIIDISEEIILLQQKLNIKLELLEIMTKY